AKDEGVSDKTVRDDLAKSGAEGYAPEAVIGEDGKTYPVCRQAKDEGIGEGSIDRDLDISGAEGYAPEAATGQDDDDCEDDHQTGVVDQLNVPERLSCYFKDLPLFKKAHRLTVELANLYQKIEGTPAYCKALEGHKHHEYSTTLRTAARAIKDIMPACPCP